MSYGQKPSAWNRPQGSQQQLNPNLFTGQLGLAASGQAFGGIPGMSLNSNLAGLVNQAAFSNTVGMNMNSMLAQAQRSQLMASQQQQQPQQMQRQQPQQQTSSPSRSQRTFIGVVTKLMETYGFVDEDVFFQTSVIRGSLPRMGDRVMVEANYNPSMPFKWNAYRIQLIQDGVQGHQQQQSRAPPLIPPTQQSQNGMGHAASNRWGNNDRRIMRDEPRRPSQPTARRSPVPAKRPVSRQRSPVRRSSPRKRESPRRETYAKRERDVSDRVERDSSVRGQSTKRETDSPPRRRQRIIPRYHCNLPKQTLPLGEMKNADLRRRYANLYIPSDFIHCNFDWISSIPLECPLKLSPYAINFHILHKDIDAPLGEGEQLPLESPPDADFRYVVKVLLISHPGLAVIRQKLSGLLSDGSIDESTETQTLTKNIQILVGHRGKGEYMCIGGPWSPSMDGPNPLTPQTLVQTAIRTTRALTGLDLVNCSRWYKIAHLRYLRTDRQRVDSVVLMLPDTSAIESFRVTDESFCAAEQALRDQLAAKLSAIDAEQFSLEMPNESHEEGGGQNGASAKPLGDGDGVEVSQQKVGDESEKTLTNQTQPLKEIHTSSTEAEKNASSFAPEEESMEASPQKSQSAESTVTMQSQDSTPVHLMKKESKTHWSVLETSIRTMKVAEFREELELRGLDTKGLKNQLSQRLLEAIEKEKGEEKGVEEGGEDKEKGTEAVESVQEKQSEIALNQSHEKQPLVEDTLTAVSPQSPSKDQEAESKAEESSKKDETSIMVQIKEEIIELMETDEASEEKKETPEEKAKREKLEKERQEWEKQKEKFEKDKKERKSALERHYAQIPKEHGTFVYPSKTAKSGKFECKLLSLNSLLDYRQEDSKESSFEVFLFAEALREAIDRSNSFIVYHSVATALEREAEKKRRNEALAEACKDEEVVVLGDAEGGGKKDVEKEKEKEDKDIQVVEKQHQPKSPVSSTDLRTNFKSLVNNLDAFSAFVHFDTNICGYLTDRDLEEIIFSTGLDLSRGEVKNLVKKLTSKDRINYRDITDKWVDKDGNVKYLPEPVFQGSLLDSYKELAKGHANLLAEEEVANGGDKSVNESAGVVCLDGKLVNVKQCLQQQTKMEQECQLVLDKNQELELQLKATKEQRDSLEKKKRRLEDDVDRYRKKLHDTEKSLKKEQEDNAFAKKSLLDCKRYGERIASIVESVFPKPKEPEKSREVSKDKEAAVVGEVVLVDECKDDSRDDGQSKTSKEDGSGDEPAAKDDKKEDEGEKKANENDGEGSWDRENQLRNA